MKDEYLDMALLDEEAGDAYDILEGSLTEEDLERLAGIRAEINHHIRWKKVIAEAFGPLLLSMESVIFKGGEGITSQGHPPFEQLFPVEQEYVNEKGDLRRNYLVLQLVKKLLGALKTRVNQALADVPMLDLDQEDELRELILEHESELLVEDNMKYDPEMRRKFFDFSGDDDIIDADFEEEEMDLVAEINSQDREPGSGFQRPMSHSEEMESPMGNIISADLSRPDSTTNCHHNSTTTTYITEEGERYAREYCKMCRRVIRKEKLGEIGQRQPADPEKCKHSRVLWVEGKEGEEAYCTECEMSPVPNPEKYNWVYAGLEPYGDNPDEDEVQNLAEAIACES